MNSYNKTTWVNGAPPALNAAQLNKIEDALAEVIDLANANHDGLDEKMEYVTNESVSNAVKTGKVYYTTVDSSKALIVPCSGESSQVQFRLDRDGKIYSRRREKQNGAFPAWGVWTDLSAAIDPAVVRQIVETYIVEHGIDLAGVERTANRVNVVNAQSDDEHYPTAGAVKAVIDVVSGYMDNQLAQVVNEVNRKASMTQLETALSAKADKSTTLAGYGITDAYKKIEINQMFNQVDADLQEKADANDTYTKSEVDAAIQTAIGSIETQLSQV